MAGKVKRKGIGFKKYFKKLKVQVSKNYQVGFTDPEIATYMGYNEYGTRTIPSRPFFRTALKQARKEMAKKVRQGFKKRGRPSIRLAAQALKEEIESQIIDWSSPGNAPSTIKRKGFNDPLIWTGKAFDNLEVRKTNKRIKRKR